MNKKLLARAHIVKAQSSISDVIYRDLLQEFFGVSSSKELSDEQGYALLALPNPALNNGMTAKQKAFIDALLSQVPVGHPEGFASKVCQRKIVNMHHLTKDEASLVIRALGNYERHQVPNTP